MTILEKEYIRQAGKLREKIDNTKWWQVLKRFKLEKDIDFCLQQAMRHSKFKIY